MAKRHPSAAGFGGWPMGSIAWRGTFSELQDIIAKCLATKKFPAKPLAGNSAWRATSLRMPRQSPKRCKAIIRQTLRSAPPDLLQQLREFRPLSQLGECWVI